MMLAALGRSEQRVVCGGIVLSKWRVEPSLCEGFADSEAGYHSHKIAEQLDFDRSRAERGVADVETFSPWRRRTGFGHD